MMVEIAVNLQISMDMSIHNTAQNAYALKGEGKASIYNIQICKLEHDKKKETTITFCNYQMLNMYNYYTA